MSHSSEPPSWRGAAKSDTGAVTRGPGAEEGKVVELSPTDRPGGLKVTQVVRSELKCTHSIGIMIGQCQKGVTSYLGSA